MDTQTARAWTARTPIPKGAALASSSYQDMMKATTTPEITLPEVNPMAIRRRKSMTAKDWDAIDHGVQKRFPGLRAVRRPPDSAAHDAPALAPDSGTPDLEVLQAKYKTPDGTRPSEIDDQAARAMTALLDSIPGAFEAAQAGLADARAGRVVELEDL